MLYVFVLVVIKRCVTHLNFNLMERECTNVIYTVVDSMNITYNSSLRFLDIRMHVCVCLSCEIVIITSL